jgi:hypothetical protein
MADHAALYCQTTTGVLDVKNDNDLAKAIVGLTNRMDALYELIQAPLTQMQVNAAGYEQLLKAGMDQYATGLRHDLERHRRMAVAEIKRARLGYFDEDDT